MPVGRDDLIGCGLNLVACLILGFGLYLWTLDFGGQPAWVSVWYPSRGASSSQQEKP